MTDDPVSRIDLMPDLRPSRATGEPMAPQRECPCQRSIASQDDALSAQWVLPSLRGPRANSRLLKVAAIATAQLVSITAAVSAPPQNSDTALASWYRSLKAPNGSGCCDIADCRSTESRITAEGYEAMIENKWVAVPRERVLTETSSPTGRAVVCYQPGYPQMIYCFVRPPES